MWTMVENWTQTLEKLNNQSFGRLHSQVHVATEFAEVSMKNLDEVINLMQANVQSAFNVWKSSVKDLQSAQEKSLDTKAA
jgi:hypothetical protein